VAFVKTIRGNFEGFTKKEIEKATLAREAQGMIGHPSERDFKDMVSANMIQNCPVTPPRRH
jgi:hypothetical protein